MSIFEYTVQVKVTGSISVVDVGVGVAGRQRYPTDYCSGLGRSVSG